MQVLIGSVVSISLFEVVAQPLDLSIHVCEQVPTGDPRTLAQNGYNHKHEPVAK